MLFLTGCIFSLILSLILAVLFIRSRLFRNIKPIITGFLIVILAAATLLLYFSAYKFDYYMHLKQWPVAKGIIIEKEVVGDRAIMPLLKYQYNIDGKQFQGTSDLETPSFGNRKFRDQTARNVLKNFSAGDTVNVYYNPQNISQSLLKINPPWSEYMQFGLAIILQIISASLLFTRIYSKNKVIHESSR